MIQADRRGRVLGWTQPTVRGLTPYYKAPVEGRPLRLDQNTNLFGPNPAIARFDAAGHDVAQYPSRDGDALLAALSDWHGLPEDRFVLGNGSDEILDLLTKAFTAPGQTLAFPSPSYSLYPFYGALQDLRVERVPLRGAWRLDVDAMLAAKPTLAVVASPNNPTGNRVPTGELERLAAGIDGILVVDEAYIEYAGLKHSLLPRVDGFDNLCVMRTFSKAYGLAGLRVGYLAGNPDIIERLRLVKPPFNLNLFSEAIAVAALDEQEWVDDGVATVRAERERMQAGLKAAGLRPHPSDANFILCDVQDDPAGLSEDLRRRGILARTFPGGPGLEHAIRFTIGRPEDNDRLLAALADIGVAA